MNTWEFIKAHKFLTLLALIIAGCVIVIMEAPELTPEQRLARDRAARAQCITDAYQVDNPIERITALNRCHRLWGN
jgi:hypothetical protein